MVVLSNILEDATTELIAFNHDWLVLQLLLLCLLSIHEKVYTLLHLSLQFLSKVDGRKTIGYPVFIETFLELGALQKFGAQCLVENRINVIFSLLILAALLRLFVTNLLDLGQPSIFFLLSLGTGLGNNRLPSLRQFRSQTDCFMGPFLGLVGPLDALD